MVALTYPLIGNYGINAEDFESRRVQVEGLPGVYSYLSDVFSQSIRTYLCSLMEDTLVDQLGDRLEVLNEKIAANFDVALTAFDVDVELLPNEEVAAKRWMTNQPTHWRRIVVSR